MTWLGLFTAGILQGLIMFAPAFVFGFVVSLLPEKYMRRVPDVAGVLGVLILLPLFGWWALSRDITMFGLFPNLGEIHILQLFLTSIIPCLLFVAIGMICSLPFIQHRPPWNRPRTCVSIG